LKLTLYIYITKSFFFFVHNSPLFPPHFGLLIRNAISF